MHTHPCPSCGYCPTCGRSAAPRVSPRPIWITPNAYPTYGVGDYTAPNRHYTNWNAVV